MAHVHIDPAKLAAANRYANLLRNKPKRDYANAYIAFLQNGAEGPEPDRRRYQGRGRLSYMAAQAVRLQLNAMELWS